jgi:hypothetical protein
MPRNAAYDIFGHPCTLVVRWMGANGWTPADALRTLNSLGCPVAASTVGAYINDIRNGRGPAADITPEQASQLNAVRHGLDSSTPTPQRTPTPPPAPRSPRPLGHRPPRPRRAALHVPQHPALRVAEDVGSDYRVTMTHADRELVNRLARWLDRQLVQYQAERDEAERLDRVLGGEGDILGDLIAESRKVGAAATYSAEGGFRTNS